MLMQGKIFVKQSLSDAYRQYLEDVTIPMNTYLDAPEEFVTTKPSIYHSLRMQPATDARTGRVRNSPAIARALASNDNLQFQNDIRDFSLPLNTNQGLPLYGRHVYPGELYSFNPSFGKETHLPDLPVTYKQTWGDGTKNRPLNLYGFTGNAPTPQRFTSSTFQPEGIIYGNLDENDVIQLNTRPASAERFAQVARALSPFHPSRDIKHLGVHSEDLARDIMDAGIPPILAESNVDTKGITQHLPFRLDEKIDVQEAHDPFAQYDMGNLNRPTPEGLGHFTLDSIRAGEPMDISMQLLKASLPTMREAGLSFEDLDALRFIPNYRKTSFYQPQLLNKPANITYEKNTASQKPEYKRIPGLQTEIGPPQNNIHSYFVNPATRLGVLSGDVTFMAKPTLLGIRNNDKDYGVDFWRTQRQGAGSEGGEGIIYGELPKQNFAEIPINYTAADAMRAKLNLDHFMDTFHIPEEEAFEMLATRFPEVHNIASQFPNVNTQDTSWQQPAQYRGTNPLLLDEIDTKVASEPMDIAMRLLKEARPHALIDNFHLEMLLSPKSSARPKLLRQYFPHATSEDKIPMNELATEQEIRQRDTDYFPLTQAQQDYREKESPPIFANVATDKVSYDPYWQDILTGEPMDIAFQLLKKEIPYSSRDYPPQEISVSTGTPLVTPKVAGETPEVCNMPGCESGLPPVIYRRMANPIRSIDNHQFMCEQCAYKNDLQSLLYHKMLKGEITPMELAMQLLKERVSPEAKRHKLEYDKKYESSPERVKYREELNRERRRRHIMGRGGPDMSHTKDHTIVPESPHTNRARHFKDKGTLL